MPALLRSPGRAHLLEGYEVFREFDRSTLALCEPPRAFRIIYASAWIARRWDDRPSGRSPLRDRVVLGGQYEALFGIFEALGS